MFLDRPDVDFGVELANIGFDNFGIEDWLHDMVEDAIQEKLVYPGNFRSCEVIRQEVLIKQTNFCNFFLDCTHVDHLD